ncbi:MAG TPA: DPP IV N-terminal domain-containing protein [Gammaproteobacteria bacterium]|nr:DPP IV N-terminal domain-containing protein [Gammaproteobacteria bacterium]
MRHRTSLASTLALFLVPAMALAAPPSYSIADIFAEPGLTGYAPENVQWSRDGQHLTYFLRDPQTKLADLYMVDVASSKTALLMSGKDLAGAALPPSAIKDQRRQEWITRYGVASYHWAKDGSGIYYQSGDQLYFFRLADRKVTQLTREPGEKSYPELSPDGKWIAYVNGGELHYAALAGGAGAAVAPHVDGVLNGMLDWVYTEELELRSAYEWSDDSRYLAFLQFDERPVHGFPLVNYVEQQPGVYLEDYPLAGAPNPLVKLGVRDVKSDKTTWLKLAGSAESYLARFGWLADKDELWALVLDRSQTHAQLYLAKADGKDLHVLASFTDPWWIDVRTEIRFLKDGDFLWTTAQDGWTHLYLFDSHGRVLRKLTSGDYNVVTLAGVDEAQGIAYFTRYSDGPLNTALYAVPLAGGEPRAVSGTEGTHEILMSRDGSHYLDTWSTAMTPPQVSLCDAAGRSIAVVHAAAKLPYAFVQPKFFTLTAADGAAKLYARLTLPPDFDPHKKYPVIMYQYGGPDVPPLVRDAWGGTGFLFDQRLAAQGYVLFATDNSAATYFSHSDQAKVKLHLGKLALDDQLAAVAWLKTQAYVDATRIGLWGWSYGGYMTAYALTHAPGTWRTGIAVASVTQWQDYDSVYTERYMQTPAENPQGYAESSAVAAAGKLSDPLLLVAGTGDDNVHWQNTLQLVQGLIDAGKPYELLVYPNSTHGIAGPAARTHLFTAMDAYWKRQLQP